MKTEQEIRYALERFAAIARHAKRVGEPESYEVCANLTMALGWVLGIGVHHDATEDYLKSTRTVNPTNA